MAGTLVVPDGWTPEFPGQRPPFAPGNEISIKHGAFSSKRVDPIANRFLDEYESDPTSAFAHMPRFRAQVWNWAIAMARVELLDEWVSGMSMEAAAFSGKGQVSPLELLRKWIATAQTLSSRIGADPLSAARLSKDITSAKRDDAATLLTSLRTQHEASQHDDTQH